MSQLTREEKSWLKRLQKVMDECPSPDRIGFYTVGDPDVSLYDRSLQEEINNRLDRGEDFGGACEYEDAGFNASIRFPSNVHSTAG